MKHAILLLTLLATLSVNASEHNATNANHALEHPSTSAHHKAHAAHHKSSESDFYIVSKVLITLPSELTHEGNALTSSLGKGVGIDLGYHFTHHFSIEFDFSYDVNSVYEDTTVFNGQYFTYAASLAYTLPLTHHLVFQGKAGAELEIADIADLHFWESEPALAYGLALEYELTSHYEVVVEYEGSTAHSLRGSSFYTGMKYLF